MPVNSTGERSQPGHQRRAEPVARGFARDHEDAHHRLRATRKRPLIARRERRLPLQDHHRPASITRARRARPRPRRPRARADRRACRCADPARLGGLDQTPRARAGTSGSGPGDEASSASVPCTVSMPRHCPPATTQPCPMSSGAMPRRISAARAHRPARPVRRRADGSPGAATRPGSSSCAPTTENPCSSKICDHGPEQPSSPCGQRRRQPRRQRRHLGIEGRWVELGGRTSAPAKAPPGPRPAPSSPRKARRYFQPVPVGRARKRARDALERDDHRVRDRLGRFDRQRARAGDDGQPPAIAQAPGRASGRTGRCRRSRNRRSGAHKGSAFPPRAGGRAPESCPRPAPASGRPRAAR